MLRRTILLIFCVALMAASTLVHAQTVNFAALPNGTLVTNQFPAFTVSLMGGPDSSGSAMVEGGFGLCNTNGNNGACQYPTANILDFAFTNPTNEVGFIFNDAGDNGVTSYYAYNASDVLVASGNISSVQGWEVDVFGTGITDLNINNLMGFSSWYYVVSALNPTGAINATPEPSTCGLTGIGLAMLGLMRKRLVPKFR